MGTSSSKGTQWNSNISNTETKFTYSDGSLLVNNPIQFNSRISGQVNNVEWDFGDGNTSNELNPKHVYEKEGCYDVVLTSNFENACFQTHPETICIEPPVNIDVYPNPSNGVYTIDVNSKDIRITVYNLIGELILSLIHI